MDVCADRGEAILGGPTVACTIVSKNYLSCARALMRSLEQHHEEIQRATLLVDECDGFFEPDEEPFRVFLASRLGIPNWSHMSMKYDITELNTAVKPYFLETLFEKLGARHVIFFDPDIVVYRRLDELLDLLERYNVVLTPHILEPVEDEGRPAEIDFLRVGAYNLGFVAMARRGPWRRLLRWWQRRVYSQCTREPDKGLFVDQHWMDLAPSLFEGVHVLRDPGYNVAYWNFASRELTRDRRGYTVNGRPLTFFHYSGFVYDDLERVSKHQDRFVLSNLSDAYQARFRDYKRRLRDCGYEETRGWPYAYATLRDGTPISDILRICLRRHDPDGGRWPDPYDTASEDGFLAWATRPREDGSAGSLSAYALTLYEARVDLQQAFPSLPVDHEAFARWFVQQRGTSDIFHPAYVDPVAERLKRAPSPDVVAETPSSLAHSAHGQPSSDRWGRFVGTVRYYASYPAKIAPALPPGLIDVAPEIYTGPAGVYGWVRRQLARAGVLQRVRKLVGLRLILTARYFFNYPQVPAILLDPGGSRTLPLAASTEAARPVPESTTNDEKKTFSKPENADSNNEVGVNVIGFLCSESGVGEIARRVMHCLDRVGVSVAQLPIHAFSLSTKSDDSIGGFPIGTPNAVNIFHVNADMTFKVRDHVGTGSYDGKYNVGYWFWELGRFPERWRSAFDVYDEIWVSSGFAQAALAARATRPVVRVPVSVDVRLPEKPVGRVELGLPEDAFLVLYVFDALSIVERKNPWGAIQAFESAFSEEIRRSRARLVIKVMNLHLFPNGARRLRDEMKRVNGILIEGYLDRLRTNALIEACDVYLSLHRSEGYGLTIAEAMYLGKPIIATAYSGNMDFMTPDNSYLVPYRLVELERDYPPYDRGNVWADPDCDAAAVMLRSVFERPDQARARGERARQAMVDDHNAEAVGTQIRSRLEVIRNEIARRPPGGRNSGPFVRGG